ncbi:SigmaW regulon antibacterial [Poriferisphaera corsica]|uniref:Flotillin-like protein FloA n=1 Tax=Poriferisphaera corsica TaxID=2528020 RepID=A0A517YQC1_9BACT|nr:flotillin-like protein FloA [Poriferisphaera corsica]QDU32425.1 SigmaW regulon antibacterial [Poriferisphaera corsica]
MDTVTSLAQSIDPWAAISVVAFLVGGIFLLIFLFFVFKFANLWIQAQTSKAPVKFIDLVGMWLRKVNPKVIVLSRIQSVRAGIDISTSMLEGHYLSGGNVPRVVNSLIAADKAKIQLPFDEACAIDLAGRDILEAIRTSVDPKVIDCPSTASSSGDKLDAVAKDGIRLLCKARVTVRTNLARLVGGATEETIIARVGQAIVSAIGSQGSYKDVLENPDKIAKRALESGLDAGTAFSILSVDIADVSVAGVDREANVGAKLQAEQAEADKQRFQAEAEKRRALAIAQEQEFKAEVQKSRALVVLAEAEVPKAMAEAFRSGNMGIMDFYRMKNIQADTSMRDNIGGGDKDDKGKK